MKGNLDDFINDNREAFDSYEPGDNVWKAIDKLLPAAKKNPVNLRLTAWIRRGAIAASVLLISTAAYYFFNSEITTKKALVALNKEADIPAEYAEELYHFTKLIELKHKQLKKIEKNQPELYRQFADELSKLDSNYQVLRNELPGHPNREVLIQTMIGNLKWQIDLLNEQLNILKKINQSKNTSNEKTPKSA